MSKKNINKKYKDRLFRLVFQEKPDLLALYNAVNLSSYSEPENLEITTLDDVIYMGMKNDISFLIDDILNLYEHQSTYNPNMPARGFLYLADLYRKHMESRKLNLYSRRLVTLPFPKYLVFYNGLQEEPDRTELRLSDAFCKDVKMEPCLELKVVMININLDHNRELMDRCRKLQEYARFVAEVRKRIDQGLPMGEAVNGAVEICIEEEVLAEFLLKHRAEVYDMVLTEYDEQSHIACEREESLEEGRIQGRIEGRAEGRLEGKTMGIATSVLELLEDVGEIPNELRTAVMNQTDLSILTKWLKLASKVETVEAFLEQYNKG